MHSGDQMNMPKSALERYHAAFPNKYSLIVAIHAQDIAQTLRNTQIATDNGADGILLVDHEFDSYNFIKIMEVVRNTYPDIRLGVNMLGEKVPTSTFDLIKGHGINGVQVDRPRIKEINGGEDLSEQIKQAQLETGFDGLYFGGLVFKGQRIPIDLPTACAAGLKYLDVITTSGSGTGIQANETKVQAIRNLIGDAPLALASGTSARNIRSFPGVNAFIVASSINKDFYHLDPLKVKELTEVIAEMNVDTMKRSKKIMRREDEER